MSEKDNFEKVFRKRQRSILNVIREACIYRSSVMIYDGTENCLFPTIAIREKDQRDLNEERVLITKGELRIKSENYFLRIENDGEVVSIPITLQNEEVPSGFIYWQFKISQLVSENRRKISRKTINESFFSPVLIYLAEKNTFPVSGFARIVDYDTRAVSFELRFNAKISETYLKTASVLFQSGTLPFTETKLKIALIRNFYVENNIGENRSSAIVVSNVVRAAENLGAKRSVIESIERVNTDFRFMFREHFIAKVNILDFLDIGFIGSVEKKIEINLPPYFIAEHFESGIRFNVTNHDNSLVFWISSSDLGTRVQWYNFLTKSALGYQYQFRAEDAKDVTRLMLESGNYTKKALEDIVLQHEYLSQKWPLEEKLPRTKFRWLVKDAEGTTVGHTSGLRVSERLWTAIDNVGSQNYIGSWNSDYVSKWIRCFQELIGSNSSKELVQWTYSAKAAIWSKFQKSLEFNRPDLIYTKDYCWGYYFTNSVDQEVIERVNFSGMALSHPEDDDMWISEYGLTESKLLKILYEGTSKSSNFSVDYEHDYSSKFSRFFYLILKNDIPTFLLTFGNYASWASLHKGNDWSYLFPIGNVSQWNEKEEKELLNLIRELIFSSGCLPYRLGLMSKDLRLSDGDAWINLIFKPEALKFAAESIEKA